MYLKTVAYTVQNDVTFRLILSFFDFTNYLFITDLPTGIKRKTDRALKLRIKATSSSEVSVILSIRLTATYPKTIPLVKIEQSSGLREATKRNINQLLQTKPNQLVGEVMIHELATSIEDLLEDAFQKQQQNGEMPSLEEERALQEATATEAAKQLEAVRLREAQLEKAEEDRVLQQMLDDEITRREAKRKSREPLLSPGTVEYGTYMGPTLGDMILSSVASYSDSLHDTSSC